MLMPKRVKRRRVHRGRMKGAAHCGNVITYGEYGLVAMEPAWITSNQIEKPAETRMGSGKGAPEYWVAVVKPGRVMFEIAGVSEEIAHEALRLAMHKLPIKCKIAKKEEVGGESNEG